MKIKFIPQNVECEIKPNQTVLDVAKENNIQIKSVCGGLPSCAECRVQIQEGEYNVAPPSPKEISLIGTAYFVDRSRLSCQLKCFGDVTINMSEQIEKQSRPTSTKRARGARTQVEGRESQAVLGSMILDEKIDIASTMNAEDVMEKQAADFMEFEQRRKLHGKAQPNQKKPVSSDDKT